MRQDTTKGDGGTNQGVELFVTTDGELQVAGGDTLDFEILGGVLQLGRRENRVSIEMLCFIGWDKNRRLGSNRGTRGLTPASSRTSAVRYSSTAVT